MAHKVIRDDIVKYKKTLAKKLVVTVGLHAEEGSKDKKDTDAAAARAEKQDVAQHFADAAKAQNVVDRLASKRFKSAKARANLEVRLARAREHATYMAQRAARRGEQASRQAPLSLIEVAEFHEFGLGNNPNRSFVRALVDEREGELQTKLARSLKTALKPGGRGAAEQMARFGEYVAGQMKQRIADGIPPELNERYKRRKAALTGQSKDTPLILTGQLRSSIRARLGER